MKPILKSNKETADILGVKEDTLDHWRVRGHGPRFVRIGRRIMYRLEDIEAFITAGVRSSTSQEVA